MVLHYSYLFSADSPTYPLSSLPITSGDVSPHESTWAHHRSSLPVVFIDIPASSCIPSLPIDVDNDPYLTMESDSVFLPPVSATTLHTEWEPSSHDHKWKVIPDLDHSYSVGVEASYRFSDLWDILDNIYE